MSKITITLRDDGNGNVRIDADPTMPTLAKMHKDGAATPAEGYAILALGTIVKASLKEAQEKMKERMKGQILMPQTPRFPAGHA